MLKPHEIAEEIDVSDQDIKVRCPDGEYHRVLKLFRTVSMSVWKLTTMTGRTIRASRKHLLVGRFGFLHYLYEYSPGDEVLTEDGYEKVISCRPDGEEELYDMEVDSDEHLYYTDGFVSHNSTTFAARQMALANSVLGYRSLYVAPHHTHLETYQNRYAEMEALWQYPFGHQLKGHKEYGTRSVVEMIYCGENSLNARGKTVDEVLLDEVQSLDPTLLEDILYTQTTSSTPSTIYAGTAMSIDTLLEAKWQDSSMGVWYVKSPDGKHWLNFYDPDTLFAVCSKPSGPTCPYTGRPIDVSSGHFVHANSKALEAGRIGIHVPQCIIADLANNPIQWGRIYQKVTRTDPNKVMQECFGIAVATGAREITQRDLQRLCVLDLDDDQIKERCRTGYYRLIVSGCDWGGSDYNAATKTKQSYTVHCILGLAPDGATDILHYYRYSGMDYESIANSIIRDHYDYNGQLIATDFGVGAVYNMQIRKKIPFDQHFIMTYVGPKSAPLAEPKGPHLPNQLSLNKTEAISAVFSDVKFLTPQKIRCRRWDLMSDYLMDWLNLFRAPVENESGETKFKYIRAATKPDDALHAFTFAYVLIKFFIGEPIVNDPTLQARLREIMNHPEEVKTPALDFTKYMVSG